VHPNQRRTKPPALPRVCRGVIAFSRTARYEEESGDNWERAVWSLEQRQQKVAGLESMVKWLEGPCSLEVGQPHKMKFRRKSSVINVFETCLAHI